MQFNDFLAILAQSLLIIALPVVIVAALQHFRVMSDKLKEKLGEDEQKFLQTVITTAVKAAEQTGIIEQLTGPEKREQAIKIAQQFLDERDIKIDVDNVAALVEAEVLTQFNNPTMPADTPAARQALIDRAVKSAVQAAEESGLKGVIQNVGEQKKAYAFQLALGYLDDHGLDMNSTVLSGLIDAEVMQEYTRPDLPSMTPEMKQNLIDKAVETGVLAAEQSGNQGLIENSGAVKKSYAMHLAKEYLQEHGIKITNSLLSGMIEAQLQRMGNV